MHDLQTGVNMTYLTMKEYKLTPFLQLMVLNNWYMNHPTYLLVLHHVLTWFLQTNRYYWLTVVLIPLFTLIVTIKLFTVKLICKFEDPPLHQRHVWNYVKANKDAILSALQNIDWHRLFASKTTQQKENLLTNIILKFFKTFVSSKFVMCDDRTYPG